MPLVLRQPHLWILNIFFATFILHTTVETTSQQRTPGAHYLGGPNDANLPVATPIEASVVGSSFTASAPPMKESYTTTTVYRPDGSIQKQPYATSTQLNTTTMATQAPLKQTFITTIPPPVNNNNASRSYYGNNNILEPGFRRAPTRMNICPSCQQQNSRTQTRTLPTLVTWVAAIALLIVFWPICWIPLVCDVFKQTDHYCSRCGTKVAEVTPFGDCCEKRRGWDYLLFYTMYWTFASLSSTVWMNDEQWWYEWMIMRWNNAMTTMDDAAFLKTSWMANEQGVVMQSVYAYSNICFSRRRSTKTLITTCIGTSHEGCAVKWDTIQTNCSTNVYLYR